MPQKSFFTPGDSGRVVPTPYAYSLWGPDSLNGPSLCALAARAAECEHGRDGWLASRFTLELFKSARRLPTDTRTRVLRDGRRIAVIQVDIVQFDGDEENLVAQGNVVFLRQGSNPPGARWARPDSGIDLPADDPDDALPWMQDDEHDWSHEMAEFQNGNRRRIWSRPIRVLPDEELTAFTRAAISAESTSLVTNWGEGGIGFINCDLTMVLTRLPVGERVGVEADNHLENDGVSAGTANLFDVEGQYGIGMVTAVDNTRAMIDFTKVTRPSAEA
ncbi:acyl-CoA thioesterase domain-containing protein [Gordonia humi]|uniref:Acyl-CoA thioesterase-like N-terminal HotDog domain-containing protein n=1 Tax=Gordonia humi TaxID=686429 RepID=A0A840F319_9ACTN|nr:acyl-CoA thioesterase domain-containing protein [Gordonia humi]MBB4134680.1 hypothetical protein [Gordonia humi]